MRMLVSFCCAVAVSAAATAASAAEYSPLFPTPAVGQAVVGFDHHKEEGKKAEPIKLFECVKVRDRDHIAPCAETKIVKVLDPCWKPDPCACCQKPSCVYVAVCVPKQQPCCAPKPGCCAPAPCHSGCKPHGRQICKDGGRYVKLDYGKYRVEIRVKKGYVEVDYDD